MLLYMLTCYFARFDSVPRDGADDAGAPSDGGQVSLAGDRR